jgi:hypothetical protein
VGDVEALQLGLVAGDVLVSEEEVRDDIADR